MNRALARIRRELHNIDWSMYVDCGISVKAVDGNLKLLKGEISGPPDTPYEGGNFILEINVPDKYPFDPPRVRFFTKIWHPSVNSISGEVYFGDGWYPAMTLSDILISLQVLLSTADTDRPFDQSVAKQCKENPDLFKRTARHWTQAYAGAPGSFPDFETKIKQLMDVGIKEDKARETLSYFSWDVEKAAAFLDVVRPAS